MTNENRVKLKIKISKQTQKKLAEIVRASEKTDDLYNRTSGILKSMIISSAESAELNPHNMDKFDKLVNSIINPGGGIPIIPKSITVAEIALGRESL